MPDDDKVGYKRPPKAMQFQKGKSGNPKGRPKHTRNLKTDLAEELTSRISITAHGRATSVTKQKALVMALMARAIKGDMRAATYRQSRQAAVRGRWAVRPRNNAAFDRGPRDCRGIPGTAPHQHRGSGQ